MVTGASGGVGSALVQLAKRRGAIVTAVTSKSKADQVRAIGAANVINRGEDIIAKLGESILILLLTMLQGMILEIC